MQDPDFDVVVVGSGGAGLVAALSAAEQGASVLVVESESEPGGATRLAAGMMMAAETPVQLAAGLTDDKDSLYLEYMLANQWSIKPAIARRLADEGGPLIEWLTGLGVRFMPFVVEGGGERVARTHVPDGGDTTGGQHLVDELVARCRQRGIEFALGNQVESLLERDGEVVGVRARGEELTARAVVVATGGFGANAEMITEHLPSIGKFGDQVFYIGPDSSRGDGLEFAARAGANMVGHDNCKPSLTPRAEGTDFDAYIPAWLLLLGPDGRRVCDETAPYGQTYGLARAVGDVVYGIFDSRTLADNNTDALPTFKAPIPPNIWTREGIERMIASGGVVEAAGIEELAGKLGLPTDAVLGAVERYNSFADAGEDRDHGKSAQFLRPVRTGPFYGAPMVASVLGITAYGIEIDGDGHVMTPDSRELPGLFAAGECTGGVIGSRYVGNGNGLASALVFGRVAGRSAGAYATAGD